MTTSQVVAALRAVTSALPAAEERPGQVAMAEAVATAIESGRHLVVQAGTGTGKTIGYLVPAILAGKRVVVATATKALQDQLAAKDLPFLQEHLDHPFGWAVLKGRSNYVCRQRVTELEATDSGQGTLEIEEFGASHVMLGSDYPYDMGTFECARQVKALPVNDVDKATILNGMAQKLLAGVN